MKKWIAVICICAVLISLAGCAASDKKNKPQGTGPAANAVEEEQSLSDSSATDSSEAKTDDVQMESTVVDETLTGMMKPLDAIMLTELVNKKSYQPDDPTVYWNTVYYYLCLYGPMAKGTSYDSKKAYLIAGADVVRETGRILFGETVREPGIPKDFKLISLHDNGKYYVKNNSRPESYPVFSSAVKNSDGSYEVIAQLADVHGKILVNHSFHLTPKNAVNDLLGQKYYYSVSTAGVG